MTIDFEAVMTIDFEAVMPEISALCREYGIAELSVFGSIARGEDSSDSDIDSLYVWLPDNENSYWELMELEEKLTNLLGRKVELVPKHHLHWIIRDRVLAEAGLVYVA